MNTNKVKIESSWKDLLKDEFSKPYFEEISTFLRAEKKSGKKIYPPGKMIFNAFEMTPVEKVKVVIIGQDPYHGFGQAMGLCFSVPQNIAMPPSVKNIYKELITDIGIDMPSHADLTPWANQGVLLLNAILTVEHKKPASHRKIGWQNFTDAAITEISKYRENLVFMLWGNFAKSKSDFIDSTKHLILKSAHPSPFSVQSFYGNKHFSKANSYLLKHQKEPIDWQI